MFIFPEENNTGLSAVPFHYHSPLHILKVTDISQNSIVCNAKKLILFHEKNKC